MGAGRESLGGGTNRPSWPQRPGAQREQGRVLLRPAHTSGTSYAHATSTHERATRELLIEGVDQHRRASSSAVPYEQPDEALRHAACCGQTRGPGWASRISATHQYCMSGARPLAQLGIRNSCTETMSQSMCRQALPAPAQLRVRPSAHVMDDCKGQGGQGWMWGRATGGPQVGRGN